MADEPQAGGATTVPAAADPGPDNTAAAENVTEEASKGNGDKPTGGMYYPLAWLVHACDAP